MLERLRRHWRRPLGKPADGRLEALERRVADLEGVVEALQDAVHREWVRREYKTAQLERKTQPREIARALSEDARRRGI
jgi:uncharacterized coiled-coil protein SlyX